MRRLLTTAFAVALIGIAGPSDAATDTTTCRVPPAESGTAPATDIVCFALTVDCVNAVGALRVRTTDTTTYPTTFPGVHWSLAFLVDGVRHEFVLTRSITGEDAATMHVAGGEDRSPIVRVSSTTITWSVPRSATVALQEGGTLTELTATAKDALGHGWERTAKDSTDAPRSTPICG